MNIGVPELLIVLAVILLVLGPKRLPRMGRQLGDGFKELRDGIRSKQDRDDDEPGEPDQEVLDGEVLPDGKRS